MRIEQIIAAVARRTNLKVVREILAIDAFAHVASLPVYLGLQPCMACVSPGMGSSGSQSMLTHRQLHWTGPNTPTSHAWLTADAGTEAKLKRFDLKARLSGLARRGKGSLTNRVS